MAFIGRARIGRAAMYELVKMNQSCTKRLICGGRLAVRSDQRAGPAPSVRDVAGGLASFASMASRAAAIAVAFVSLHVIFSRSAACLSVDAGVPPRSDLC